VRNRRERIRTALVVLLGVFTLLGCEDGEQEMFGHGEDQVETFQIQEETREFYEAQVIFNGKVDSNSGEFEIKDFSEDFLDKDLYVFRFGPDVYREFEEDRYDEGEAMNIEFSVEETSTYRVLVIQSVEKLK